MKAAIIGGRGAGKSTVFHALTGLAPLDGQADAKSRARYGQIKIPDPRLDFLEATYGSKKKVQVELTLLDFAPNPKEQKAGAALDPSLLPMIREPDALLIVLASFGSESVDLVASLQSIEAELVFVDFEQSERRLERLKKEKGGNDFEKAALEKCLRHLEQGAPIRKLELTDQEMQVLATFCFLSQKPALVVINCDTEQAVSDVPDAVREAIAKRGLDVLKLAASFESELWELEPEAQRELLNEAGLKAPARDRLIAALYGHLGLMTFYTAGEPEAHAWSLRRGASALEAAGRIHSDIARGFIRAEVVSFEDFAALRSDTKVKEAGKLRLEGKDYAMREGDIIHIRFKV